MEILDIVDENDNIVGQATRDEVYEKSLRHRIVHILIFDNEGKMILQKRSDKVSYCPGYWATAVGGHVQTGETYKEAALRECKEELGIESEPELLAKDFYDVSNVPNKFLTVFKAKYDGDYNHNTDDVHKLQAFHIGEIKEMIERGEKLIPELLFILNKYY